LLEEGYKIEDIISNKDIFLRYNLLLEEGSTIENATENVDDSLKYNLILGEESIVEDTLGNMDNPLNYNLGVASDVKTEDTKRNIHFAASHYVAVLQALTLSNIADTMGWDYKLPAYTAYHLELLYKNNLTDLFSWSYLRAESEEQFEVVEKSLMVDRYDDYFNVIWNIKENIHVHLGELSLAENGFPLGRFILGQSTL